MARSRSGRVTVRWAVAGLILGCAVLVPVQMAGASTTNRSMPIGAAVRTAGTPESQESAARLRQITFGLAGLGGVLLVATMVFWKVTRPPLAPAGSQGPVASDVTVTSAVPSQPAPAPASPPAPVPEPAVDVRRVEPVEPVAPAAVARPTEPALSDATARQPMSVESGAEPVVVRRGRRRGAGLPTIPASVVLAGGAEAATAAAASNVAPAATAASTMFSTAPVRGDDPGGAAEPHVLGSFDPRTPRPVPLEGRAVQARDTAALAPETVALMDALAAIPDVAPPPLPFDDPPVQRVARAMPKPPPRSAPLVTEPVPLVEHPPPPSP